MEGEDADSHFTDLNDLLWLQCTVEAKNNVQISRSQFVRPRRRCNFNQKLASIPSRKQLRDSLGSIL